MRKARHIAFVLLTAPILLVVLGNALLDALPVEYEAAQRSYLEARPLQEFPSIDELLGDPQSGAFQDDVEDFFSDKVPLRDDVLLLDTKAQRACVKLANTAFGFDVYPSYLDSSAAYSRQYKRFFMIPGKFNEKAREDTLSAVERYKALFADKADRSFLVYAVPANRRLETSPAASLVDNPDSYDRFEEHFLNSLGGGCTVIDARVGFDDFLTGWSKSDHHWNIIGAYDAYTRIATALGFGDDLVTAGKLKVFNEPKSYGSLARSARWATAADKMMEYDFNLGDIQVWADGADKKPRYLAHTEKYTSGDWSGELFAGRYSEFYHPDVGELVIESADAAADRSLLIVADSFSNPMERLFTKHYKTVRTIDLRHIDMTVSEYLDDHPEIEDVVFLMQPDDLMSEEVLLSLQPQRLVNPVEQAIPSWLRRDPLGLDSL